MTITVIHCFDHNYVLPAAVAFRSMLEHAATPDATYDLHVLGTGITQADQALLRQVVAPFPQARLTFRVPPPNPFPADALPRKSHYSTDLYYKLMVPAIYAECDRAILADVDVVWEDDVAKVWRAFPADGKTLIAGAWDPGYAAYHREGLLPTGRPLIRNYARRFTRDELEKLRISAGLMLFDLAGLRREGMVERWLDFAQANRARAILPEQEPINILTCDRIVTWPHCFMADAGRFGHANWHAVFEPTVMLHFAAREKPWQYPNAPLADRWFAVLARAGLVEAWRQFYAHWSQPLADWSQAKHLFDGALKLGRHHYHLHITKS